MLVDSADFVLILLAVVQLHSWNDILFDNAMHGGSEKCEISQILQLHYAQALWYICLARSTSASKS